MCIICHTASGDAHDARDPHCFRYYHSNKDRVRLVMLYALRFEGEQQRTSSLLQTLQDSDVAASSPRLFAAAAGVLGWAGRERCVARAPARPLRICAAAAAVVIVVFLTMISSLCSIRLITHHHVHLSCCSCRRAGDLYGGANILGKARNVLRGLQGVENVYTQHVPLLVETLRLLAANDLPVGAYPYAAGSQVGGADDELTVVPCCAC
jgi:vacuolar protein sorting-associated protein 45